MLFPQSSVKDPPPDVTHATLATVERLTLLSLKLMELLAAHQANPLPEHIPQDAMFSLLQGTVRPCTTDDLADALSTHALGQHVFSPLASEYRILGNDTYLILLNDTRAISTLSDEGNHKLTATILWHAPVAENAQLRFCQLSICKAPPEGCTSAASMGARAADTLEASPTSSIVLQASDTHGTTHWVAPNQVIYASAAHQYTFVHCTDRVIRMRAPFGLVLEQLGDIVLRIHRSYAVNPLYVSHLNDDMLYLTTGASLPVPSRRTKEVRELLAQRFAKLGTRS